MTSSATSHSITWKIDDIGNYGSYLKDVAIIDENNIWAVGQIYMNDSLGNPDPNIYNAVHWDGSKWEVKKITVQFRGSYITPPLYGIYALSAKEIWISSGVPVRGDGNTWTQYHLFDMGILTQQDGYLTEIWGSSSNDIYYVGTLGTIAHYDGKSWQKIESGTNVRLTDVYGSPEGSVVWVAGFDDSYGTVFFRNKGNGFEKVLEITDPRPSYQPGQIIHVFKSLWTDKINTVYLGAIGRVYAAPLITTGEAEENIWWDYENQHTFPPETNVIRGTAGNDIFVGGYLQFIQHYNGKTWKSYPEIEGNGTWRSLAVSKKVVVAVGEQHGSIGNGGARIAIGYKINK
ncbi:MAG: hypothetical protein Q8M94_04925 [Ignavibacteria bacterium]|nr:hypothetical protein [Ignavibacteria bacterium]